MKFPVKPLKFDNPDLEKEFLEDYYHKSIFTIRVALLLGIVLYSIFGILDILLAPLSRSRILFIRFAIVSPGLLIVFGLSFMDFFKRFMQPILMFITLIAGLGIVAMVGITVETEIGLYYYAGLMLVLMWAYTFVKLRVFYASIVGWTIVLSYEVTAIVFQDMLSSKHLLNIFINNNFFFISSNVIGMFAGYMIEFYTRSNFLQRREIVEKREELQLERNELHKRITIMNNELDMARLIQQKLIPSGTPDVNIYSLYKPMEAVGGDFMDFIRFTDEKKIGIFISDVSGHGVPAALITSMIKSTIQESKKFYYDPSMMLLHLNQVLSDHTEEIFVTAFYAIYNATDRTIVYSNAGHHPPLILLQNSLSTLSKSRSVPLAIMTNMDLIEAGQTYTNSRAILPAKSKLLFYTDGLVEARNIDAHGLDFGHTFNERVMELKGHNCKIFTDTLFRELIKFRGSESFDDDICIICMDII